MQRELSRETELGKLIRESLQLYVHDEVPSDEVWARIRAKLDSSSENNKAQCWSGLFWITPVLQAALLLMVVSL